MPRTRSDLDRDAKRAEILDAAQHRLMDGGYEALSVAAIARDLGLAQNAIYWYFPSKDELFVAVLERVVEQIAHGKPRGREVVDYVVWFVDRLCEFHPLRAAVYERSRTSDVVARFERDFRALTRHMLMNAISGSVAAGDLDTATDALLSTIEGTLLLGLSKRERHRAIRFAFNRLVG